MLEGEKGREKQRKENTNATVFQDMTSCFLVHRYQRFSEKLLLVSSDKNRVSDLLRKTAQNNQQTTAGSYSRRQQI